MTQDVPDFDWRAKLQDAIAAGEKRRPELAKWELSNGIVLEMVPLTEEPIRRAVHAIPLPEIPVAKMDSGDGLVIEEEDPNDPEYEDALEAALIQRIDAGYRVATILGTKCKSAPKGQAPNAAGWLERLEVAGVEVDTSSTMKRYSEWLYLHALTNPMDAAAVAQLALQFSFVEVAELSQAILWFWDRSRRRAAAGGETDGDADPDGDNLPGGPPSPSEPAGGVDDSDGSGDPVDGVAEPPTE